MEKEHSLPQFNFYGVSPETVAKLKLISLATNIPRTRLLDMMVDDLWEKKKDTIATIPLSRKASKEVRKVLERMK